VAPSYDLRLEPRASEQSKGLRLLPTRNPAPGSVRNSQSAHDSPGRKCPIYEIIRL